MHIVQGIAVDTILLKNNLLSKIITFYNLLYLVVFLLFNLRRHLSITQSIRFCF